MPKTEFLAIRIETEMKKQLKRIALQEERSLSQACEMLLRSAIRQYDKDGAKFLDLGRVAKGGAD